MSDNCGLRDGVMHMHSGRCYEAGRREVIKRLATPEVAEAVAEAIFNATDVTLRKRYEEGNSVSGYDDEYAKAALTVIRAALKGEVA